MSEPSRRQVTRWARASVAANIVIVLTGGLVRLTDSGLGCPTWPKCTSTTWTTHEALGIHGAIEFGNRLLTYVLVAVAVGTLVAVWRWTDSTRQLRRLAVALLAGIPLQGVIGGFTVLTHLNPWLVSLHLVLSMILIAAAAVLVRLVSGQSAVGVHSRVRALVWVLAALVAIAVYLGTMVTGSGPHAGDAVAPRNGLDPTSISHVHAAAVYVLVALTLLGLALLWRTPARSAMLVVAGIEVVQAGIGIAQYELGLPVVLVAAHLVGAGLLVAATASLVAKTRRVQPAG
jgi:cytochrome c oxidase assembly protein subunit 15